MNDHDLKVQHLRIHLLLAVRMAAWLLPTTFLLGCITGWGIGGYNLEAWHSGRSGLIFTAVFGSGLTAWLTWEYYRTEGLMNRPWGRKSSSDEEAHDNPLKP
jgi:hypothetical protein